MTSKERRKIESLTNEIEGRERPVILINGGLIRVVITKIEGGTLFSKIKSIIFID